MSIPEQALVNLGRDAAETYVHRLDMHIASVRHMGGVLGVSAERLDRHDASKWSLEEFEPYVRRHVLGEGNSLAYQRAWRHHFHHNDHHWQHWLVPYSDWVMALPMDPDAALEMVADWYGASHVYSGSYDIGPWLRNHASGIRLHADTAALVNDLLQGRGYDSMSFCVRLEWDFYLGG